MSQTFVLYHPNTLKSTITIGTNGFKIIYCDDAGWELAPVSILFDKIHIVSIITTFSQGYRSFTVKASTLETPYKVNIYEIKMRDKIDEVHKLITEGYKHARLRKDKLLGI